MIQQKKQYKLTIFDYIVLFLMTIFYSSFTILSANVEGAYVMLGISLVAMIFLVLSKKPTASTYRIGKYHIFIVLFALYCFMTSFWAINGDKAVVKAVTILEILVCISIFYFYFLDKPVIDDLLLCIIYGGIIVGVYAMYYYGLANIIYISQMGERLQTEFSNVNSIAMMCSYSIMLSTYFLIYKKKWLPFLLSIWTIIIIAGVGSRKSYITIVLGVALLVLYKSSSTKWYKTAFKLIIGIVVLIGLFNVIQSVSIFTTLNKRMEGVMSLVMGEGVVDSSTKKREMYIERGLEVWKENPLLGIGMDNSSYVNVHKTYFHNNYVELLADGGVVGLLIFYLMYGYLLWGFWKYRRYNSIETLLISIFFVVILINHYGQVDYYSKETYFYLMIGYLFVDLKKNEYKRFRQVKS